MCVSKGFCQWQTGTAGHKGLDTVLQCPQTPNETYTMYFDAKVVPLTATPLPYQNKQQINQKSLS